MLSCGSGACPEQKRPVVSRSQESREEKASQEERGTQDSGWKLGKHELR